jgi:ribosomal protein S18 acetylase RimI-like enzyme
MRPSDLTIDIRSPDDGAAAVLIRAYFTDIVGRYHSRPADAAEVEAALSGAPSADLQGPTGVFVVAQLAGAAAGCGGMRIVDAATGELTRIYVEPAARGLGVGELIVRRLEVLAAEAGLTRLRLDTRSDLVEARRLYARLGYVEGSRHNDDPYAEHWFAKTLP